MMQRGTRAALAAAAMGFGALALAVASTAGATTVGCQEAIAKASAGFVQAKSKALTTCEQSKLKGKLPAGTDCLSEPKTAAAIAKATVSLQGGIAKGCGGKDKICGAGGDDDSPASVGFPATCPNLEAGGCNMAINHCGDIASCLSCIGESAVDQANDLYYGNLLPTSDKTLGKCQATIGAATVKFLQAKSKALQGCWDQRLKGKHADVCPNPAADPKSASGKAAAAIAKAEAKKVAAICSACGGGDKACGGADDLTPAQIGFASSCTDVAVPGGQDCGAIGAVNTLDKLVQCVDCVTEFKVDCADRAAVPEFGAYPTECSPPPAGCTSATATISTTFDPGSPGNPIVGVTATVHYPGAKISIPGHASDPSVIARVMNLTSLTPAAGLFSAADNDTNADNIDDTVVIGWLTVSSLTTIPPGNFAKVQFDCTPGKPAPTLAEFGCQADVSDLNGGGSGTCSVVSLMTTP